MEIKVTKMHLEMKGNRVQEQHQEMMTPMAQEDQAQMQAYNSRRY